MSHYEGETLANGVTVWEWAWFTIKSSGKPMCTELRRGKKGREAKDHRAIEAREGF